MIYLYAKIFFSNLVVELQMKNVFGRDAQIIE